ncbi:MAG: hypothetical protein ACM3PX_10015 [Omnitrophica WOR_2 bacterium]
MKLTSITLLIMFMVLSLAVCGQVRVTGHVSAEVVEAASINNELNHSINIDRSQMSNIDLGSLKVSGLEHTSFDISVQNTLISNSTDSYSFVTDIKAPDISTDNTSNEISLSAILDNQAQSGDYDGRLTVIVSYN